MKIATLLARLLLGVVVPPTQDELQTRLDRAIAIADSVYGRNRAGKRPNKTDACFVVDVSSRDSGFVAYPDTVTG